jgi:hypothetical protein
MSIKTLRKRIALVAVSALGVGLLSVAPASAAIGTVSLDSAGQTSGIVTSTLAGGISGTSETATMVVTGTLVLDITTGNRVIKVTGGRIVGAEFDTTSVAKSIDAAGTCAVGTFGAIADIKFQPNAAGTNMVISTIDATACTTTTAATDKITVTVVAAGTSGTFSLANSLISLDSDTATTAGSADTPGAGFVSYLSSTGEATINYALNDALGNDMPSNTTVTATVTKGSCLVATTSGSQSVPFVTGDAPDDTIYVTSVDFKETCDVVIAVNGVTAVTKSIKFSGPVASVNVTGVTTARSSTTGDQATKGYFNVKDANGDKMGAVTVSADTTRYGNIVSAITLAAATTSTTDLTINKGSNPGSVDRAFGVTCTGVRGTQKGMRLKYTSSTGAVTYSNEFDVSCHGGLFSYSASLDAASYVPGGIATLTVSAKDSAGNPVSDGTTLNNGAGGVTNTIITCGGQATIVTAVATADAFSGGIKKYTFTLGTTEGAYNCVVSLGEYTVANTGNTALAAATVGWTLKSATASVTNAEVLAAIVKLIASINKQIKALQKSLRR